MIKTSFAIFACFHQANTIDVTNPFKQQPAAVKPDEQPTFLATQAIKPSTDFELGDVVPTLEMQQMFANPASVGLTTVNDLGVGSILAFWNALNPESVAMLDILQLLRDQHLASWEGYIDLNAIEIEYGGEQNRLLGSKSEDRKTDDEVASIVYTNGLNKFGHYRLDDPKSDSAKTLLQFEGLRASKGFYAVLLDN